MFNKYHFQKQKLKYILDLSIMLLKKYPEFYVKSFFVTHMKIVNFL